MAQQSKLEKILKKEGIVAPELRGSYFMKLVKHIVKNSEIYKSKDDWCFYDGVYYLIITDEDVEGLEPYRGFLIHKDQMKSYAGYINMHNFEDEPIYLDD